LDARLGQVYAGAYYLSDNILETLIPGGAYILDEFLASANAAAKAHGYDEDKLMIMPDEDYPRDASQTAAWSYAFGTPQDYRNLEPIYIRKAEAQRRLDEGLIVPRG
jgi:tRNA A37 threonylcarbamoyladenosine modification protein TsaB